MTLVDASLLVSAVMFSLYGLMCSAECGIAVKTLFDRESSARTLFTPIWEVTNVFLVFGFTALAMFFNSALNSLSHALLSTLAVAIVALLLRACVVITIFYWRPEQFSQWLVGLLTLLNFTIPLSFTAAGAYLLTGELFWHTALGWALVLTATIGLPAIGLLYVERSDKKIGHSLGRVFFTIWLLFLGSLLPLSITHTSQYFKLWSPSVLVGFSALGLLLLTRAKPWLALWKYAAFLGLLTPILLAWANRPYLVAGQITLKAAFGAAAYGSIFVIGLVLVLPLIFLGFWLFAQLLKPSDSQS